MPTHRPSRRFSLLAAMMLWLGCAWPVLAHNIYTSFTRIDWNSDDSSLEIIVQLHSHELEDRLSLDLGERLTFLEDADFPRLEKAAGPWTLQNLDVAADGAPLALTYLGMEMKGQEILLYLEADLAAQPKHLRVKNTMFLAYLPGQVNTIMAVVNGQRKAGEMRADSDAVELDF